MPLLSLGFFILWGIIGGAFVLAVSRVTPSQLLGIALGLALLAAGAIAALLVNTLECTLFTAFPPLEPRCAFSLL